MSSIEERLARDIAAVTGGVVVTESDVWDAREEVDERIDSRRRRGRRNKVLTSVAVAAAVVAVVGGVAVLDRDDTGGGPQPAEPPPTKPSAAYFLDLRTGTETPLPSTSSSDAVGQYAFDKAYYYAAAPDGSRVFWNTCCETLDFAGETNPDGSQGERLDPAGPVNIYGGGWSSDGTKFVYQRRDGRGEKFGNLFVKDTASGESTRITDLDQSVEGYWFLAPTFSADGQTVIFQMARPQSDPEAPATVDLWSVPASGGEPTLFLENASEPATSQTQDYAFVAGTRLRLATANGVRTLVKASTDISFPKMSPDGSKIAYKVDGSIRVLEISTGESDVVGTGSMAAWLDDSTLIVSTGTP
jgi:hypothetical protein